MNETYKEPWFPEDENAKKVFINTTDEDLDKVNTILNRIQTFIPTIDPVFALYKKDRTKEEIRQDARDLYDTKGVPLSSWLKESKFDN